MSYIVDNASEVDSEWKFTNPFKKKKPKADRKKFKRISKMKKKSKRINGGK